MLKSHLLAASSFLAIASVSAVPALAQDTSSDNAGVEQVIVSASRISIAGYTQPTPVTVVGAEQLERDAQTDIGDVIRQLPAFGTSSGPNNTGFRQLYRLEHARHRCGQSAPVGCAAHPGAVRRPAGGGVQRLGRRRPLNYALQPGPAYRCGDRRRLRRLGLRCGGRRGQRHSQQELRRSDGQSGRRRFLEGRSPLLQERTVLRHGFRRRPWPCHRQRILSGQSRHAVHQSAVLVQEHQAGEQSAL